MDIETNRKDYGREFFSKVIEASPELVCFDFFDTLVSRTVHPEDVKRIACQRIAASTCPSLTGSELYAIRSALEVTHCHRNELEGGDLEFRLSEVLADIWEATQGSQAVEKSRFIELSLAIEISIEKSVQVLDEEMIQAARGIIEAGYRCWVVSDFYFSKETFEQLLQHHGIDALFDRIEVSSDRMATKRSGKMFDAIIADSRLAPSQILMVGDNPHSDVASPRQKGMMACGIDRSKQYAKYEELKRETSDLLGTETGIKAILSSSSAAFPELALTLHHFIERLYAQLVRSEAQDVFFLAREGQLLKDLFDAYQARRMVEGASRIRSHYLEVSRRATFLPSLGPLDQEDFHTLFRQYRKISVREFLSSLGLEHLETALASQLQRDLSERHADLPSDPIFKVLTKNPLFREAYEKQRELRRSALAAYIRTFRGGDRQTTMHVVDVGWKGTIQDNLFAFLTNYPGQTGFTRIEGH